MKFLFILLLPVTLLAQPLAKFELGSKVSLFDVPAQESPLPAPPGPVPKPLVTARFIPMSTSSSEALTGPALEAGTWRCEVCNLGKTDRIIPRALILEQTPIRYLPDEFVSAILNTRTTRSKAYILKEVLKYLGMTGALASTLLGNQNGVIAGISLASILDFGPRVTAAANGIQPPRYYLPDPLPQEVAVRAGQCREYNLLAAKMVGPQIIGPVSIRLPE